MSRIAFVVPLTAMALAACAGGQPSGDPLPTDTVVRLDTITIDREVEPPLPEGRPATVCLADGQEVEIRISPAGDTLVGPRRVALGELGPAIGFLGNYASGETWFVEDEPVTFETQEFSKFGQPEGRDCPNIKIIGDVHGVNLFAEIDDSAPFGTVYVPVEPGVFQPYQSDVGRVRG